MKIAHVGAALTLVLATAPVMAQNVKITPVGSHPGELCANDRATIFEDPTGVRILYDAGTHRDRRGRSAARRRSMSCCSATRTATTSATRS